MKPSKGLPVVQSNWFFINPLVWGNFDIFIFLCIMFFNCGRSLTVELVLAKDWVRVRFPAPAQF